VVGYWVRIMWNVRGGGGVGEVGSQRRREGKRGADKEVGGGVM